METTLSLAPMERFKRLLAIDKSDITQVYLYTLFI